MKTIDTKSLLLGILATSLVLTLTSGRTIETNDNFEFLATPASVGIFNKTTKTIYFYQTKSIGKGVNESPCCIYTVADDGSSLTQK